MTSTLEKVRYLNTVFKLEDLIHIDQSVDSAKRTIATALKKGYISRVKRNLYAVNDILIGEPYANKFQIATKLADDAVVSHMSAFQYFGYYNQVSYDIYVTSQKNIRKIYFDGNSFIPLKPRIQKHEIGIHKNVWDSVQVTDLERTVLDSIYDMGKIADVEEIIEVLGMLPKLNENHFISYLVYYSNKSFIHRLGYLLSNFSSQVFSESFFSILKGKLSTSSRYLLPKSERQNGDSIYDAEWRLYVPSTIFKYKEREGQK
ncbi:MAG: hypothetical protein L0L10_05810 [Tetragenococcus sp.]|nr:hypothetical protein [Tetragenococcus sp.]